MTGASHRPQQHPSRVSPRFTLSSDTTRALMAIVAAFVLTGVIVALVPELLQGLRSVAGVVKFMIVFTVVLFTWYVALTLTAFARLGPDELTATIRDSEARRNPRLERWLAVDQLSWMLTGAGFALILVAVTVMHGSLRQDPWALAGAALLVVLSWTLMSVSGSVHLLRLDLHRDALGFPDEAPRTFMDYFYVSTTIFTTFAVSDVAATSPRSRRALTAMSISAMTFNTVVVALLVSGIITLVSG
ncbi:DUF1345 domain-containing protein [Tessaracoccus antarcticus]|uniref:DUF1345 domain-containing protein n=2 Tax=Tessaracoccus antarcticus TaxID=2479848 RepID=A0A3M0GAM7_9ACTN|nr:DUF1345 domain-containing protein [Tessaracoccus antarcticus]